MKKTMFAVVAMLALTTAPVLAGLSYYAIPNSSSDARLGPGNSVGYTTASGTAATFDPVASSSTDLGAPSGVSITGQVMGANSSGATTGVGSDGNRYFKANDGTWVSVYTKGVWQDMNAMVAVLGGMVDGNGGRIADFAAGTYSDMPLANGNTIDRAALSEVYNPGSGDTYNVTAWGGNNGILSLDGGSTWSDIAIRGFDVNVNGLVCGDKGDGVLWLYDSATSTYSSHTAPTGTFAPFVEDNGPLNYQAQAINNAGVVVGTVTASNGNSNGFVYDSASDTWLRLANAIDDEDGGWLGEASQARDINTAGWITGWNSRPGYGSFVAVPEPATMGLLLIGGLFGLIRRK